MGRGLAQEHRSGMGSALGCLGRRCRAGSMALDGEAALGAGNSPECSVLVPGVAYNFEDLAQKKREGLAMLTEAWSGRGATQVAPALRSGGEVRAALGVGRCGGVPGVRTPRLDSWYSCEEVTGLRAAGEPPEAGKSLRRRDSPAATSGEIPARWRRRPRENDLGKVPGLDVVLLRG